MTDAREDSQHRVVIIGAAITGLLVAQGLKNRGIPFSMFEAEESAAHSRQREWGMSIQWALPMLQDLLPEALLDRLQTASVDPHYIVPETGNSMPVWNAATGELLKDVPLVNILRVSRRKFRALCAEGIDIQYNKSFASLESHPSSSTMTITFHDTSTVKTSLLLAAEGAKSPIRNTIFPSPSGTAHQIPYSGVNMHVTYSSASIATFLRDHLSPIQSIGETPSRSDPENWTFQLQWTWKTGSATTELESLDLEKLKVVAEKEFAEPFRTAWSNVPEGTRVPANKISAWSPLPIPEGPHRGKVALVGDAAHAMSFHRGQGLNHGIADALQLCNVLVQGQGLEVYEEEMIKRAGEEVRISMMNTEMMHDWEKFRQSPFMQRDGDKNP